MINDLTYNEKSLGNGNKENYQTHIKNSLKICDKNDNAILRQKGGDIEKVKTFQPFTRLPKKTSTKDKKDVTAGKTSITNKKS